MMTEGRNLKGSKFKFYIKKGSMKKFPISVATMRRYPENNNLALPERNYLHS